MKDASSTKTLLHWARQGNAEALDHLFAKCSKRLRRWAHGRLPAQARDLAETDDLVQDVLARTFKRLDLFDARGEGALNAYLRQSLLNRIRDHLRRVRRSPQGLPVDLDVVDPGPSPVEAFVGQGALERYDRALTRLSNRDRELIVSTVEMGLEFEELAQITGRASADAARKAARRALVRLAAEMRRES